MAKHSERFTHQTKTKGVLACTPEATGTHCSTALEEGPRNWEIRKSEWCWNENGDLSQCSNCGTCASKFG